MWANIFSWFDKFCDATRDENGDLVWDGDHVKSRDGAPALKPQDFARLDGEVTSVSIQSSLRQ